MPKRILTLAFLGTLIALGCLGLFLAPGPSAAARLAWTGSLRIAFLVLLTSGLVVATWRFASRHRSRRDDATLLLVLVAGINFLVQASGGPGSPWQALYILLVSLTALAYPLRILALTAGTVLLLEGANWALAEQVGLAELLRNAGLVLATAVAMAALERGERRRAERTENELRTLNLGLEQLSEEEENVSPLSEEGKRRGRTEHVLALNRQLLELLKLARIAAGAHAAVLLSVEPGERSFHLRSAAGEGLDLVGSEAIPVGAVLAAGLRDERVLALSERERPLPQLPWYRAQPELHSLLAAPISDRGRTGWVMVLDHEAPERFGPGEKELAQAVATQLGEWIRATRWLAELDVLAKEFQRLYQASARLTEARRVEEILRQVLLFCGEVSAFETCAICLVGEGDAHFSVPVAEGYPGSVVGQRLPLDSPTWAGWILRSREEPLVIRFSRRSGMPVLYAGEKPPREVSFLGIPLMAKRSVNGALLLTRKGEAFSGSELRVLRILCNQAAVAIENARVYERVEEMAATDALTGLFNRRFFQEALVRELARADRERGRLALLLLDIDHFKLLNDSYGHTMGDVVLKQVAEILGGALRKGDVLARYGGEEFVIVLPSASPAGAQEFAERVRKAVAQSSIHPGGARKKVTVSVGWAIFPEDAAEPQHLLERADRALYAAKEAGRNRVVGFQGLAPEREPSLRGALSRRAAAESAERPEPGVGPRHGE